MLQIIVPGEEGFNENTNEFFTVGDVTLVLEHSLVSLSKWESKYEVPFLAKGTRPPEQTLDYIKMMIVGDFPEGILLKLTEENVDAIQTYIESKQTATTFPQRTNHKRQNETVTAELIYYWMVAHQIPFECETWHLNKLLTLIQVCNVKNSKPTKMSATERNAEMRRLNAQRREQHKTSG